MGSGGEQAVKIFALEAEDADGIDVAEFPLAHLQRRCGNLDGVIKSALLACKRFEDPTRLAATAAAKFGDCDRALQSLNDIERVPPQQPFIGAGEAILWQITDHFKQSRPDFVIQ